MIAYSPTSVARFTQPETAVESATLARLRALLMATLVLGMLGTVAELLLLDHTDGWQQLVPLALLGAGLAACLAHTVRPAAGTIRLLQAVMLLFMASGAAGVFLHYGGNVEFELEMYPEMSGLELFRNTMTGATPVLAPGTMFVFGLIGLAYAYRHPRIVRRAALPGEE